MSEPTREDAPVESEKTPKRLLDRWAPWRYGFCGHPFEWTWGKGIDRWTCPKCHSHFVIVEIDGRRKWRHEDGRDAVWHSMGIM